MDETAPPSGTDSYLAQVKSRLSGAGFSWADSVTGEGGSFRAVARQKRFQLTKFGTWETFFVFRDYPELDTASMRSYMHDAVQYAFANRASSLPRGLFAGVGVFGIALAAHVDAATVRFVREEAPPKHWASNEIPVVYDAAAPRIHYFEKTPMWGAAYYKGFRTQIEQYLSP